VRQDSGTAVRTSSVARGVSIVGHPFVVAPLLAAAVEARRGSGAAARSAALVVLLLVLPLAVLTAWQVRRGAWGTVDASHPRERPALFLVGGAGVAALLGALALTRPGSPLVTGAAGALALVAVCAAVTPWVKVSLHMATAALAAAVLLGRGSPLGWLLALGLPALGWSRVALGRHRWAEVALGLLAGAGAGAAMVRLG
jgi:hypothetical protein